MPLSLTFWNDQEHIMIKFFKLAGGKELSGCRGHQQTASRKLEYCQRGLNELWKRAEVCECLNSYVCSNFCICRFTYVCEPKYEFFCYSVYVCVAWVMSGYNPAYCWVEWRVGLSADGRNLKKLSSAWGWSLHVWCQTKEIIYKVKESERKRGRRLSADNMGSLQSNKWVQ